jgi:zinc protease
VDTPVDMMRLIKGRAAAAASFFCAAAILFAAPAPARAQRAELEKTIQRRVMPNGLEVIVVENHGVPLVTVEITVRNGSFTQTPQYAGLAHMFEHMFFKANDTYPNPDQFMDRGSEMGAVFNASTKEEQVNYYLTLSADSMEAGMKFLASALLAPKFRQDELERERQVVLGEYDRNESSPGFKLEQEMGKKLWDGEWSRKNVIGDRQVLQTVTPDKMRYIKELYYVPNNSVLIVSGDVNPAVAFASAERIFAPWKRGDDPFVKAPVPPMPKLTANSALIDEEPVNSVTAVIQWQGPSVRGDENATFAADVYSDVLNNPQSRFWHKLVDSGLLQNVVVNYYTLNNVGPITVSGQTTPEKLRAALAAMMYELGESVKPGYFSQEELDATKANRAVTSAFGEEKSSDFSHTIGFWWAASGLEYYMKYVDEMAKRTPQDLRNYATKYIIGKPHVVGVLMNHEDRARIKLTEDELIKIGGPVGVMP